MKIRPGGAEMFPFRLTDGHDEVNNGHWFLVLGIFHGVRGKLPDDVSGAAVGPETVGKFTSHTMQNT